MMIIIIPLVDRFEKTRETCGLKKKKEEKRVVGFFGHGMHRFMLWTVRP